MARDKTDKTDRTPAATLATTVTRANPSRAEIEAMLDGEVPAYLKRRMESKAQAIPGWNFINLVGFSVFFAGDAPVHFVNERQAEQLVKLAQTEADAFDGACYLAALALWIDEFGKKDRPRQTGAFPSSLRMFAASVLAGDTKRPKKQGNRRKRDADLLAWQYHLCKHLHETTTLPLSPNSEPGPDSFTACHAVAEAFTRAGLTTSWQKMRSVCRDRGYKEVRDLIDADRSAQLKTGTTGLLNIS